MDSNSITDLIGGPKTASLHHLLSYGSITPTKKTKKNYALRTFLTNKIG
jgi:hypothetical protein